MLSNSRKGEGLLPEDAGNLGADKLLPYSLTPQGAPKSTAAEGPAQMEGVAIVGIGCRFDGATDPTSFWRLLCDGKDAVGDIPSERLHQLGVEVSPHPCTPGTVATRRGSFFDRVDLFDAGFFGISPREAACMDPQHRILLEVAWEAVENAGLLPEEIAASRAGSVHRTLERRL